MAKKLTKTQQVIDAIRSFSVADSCTEKHSLLAKQTRDAAATEPCAHVAAFRARLAGQWAGWYLEAREKLETLGYAI